MQATESAGDDATTLALKPWVESTEVRNREYQWLHKIVTLHRKTKFKKGGDLCILEVKHLKLHLFKPSDVNLIQFDFYYFRIVGSK